MADKPPPPAAPGPAGKRRAGPQPQLDLGAAQRRPVDLQPAPGRLGHAAGDVEAEAGGPGPAAAAPQRGIRVTAVAPGSIQSGITETTGGMLPKDADWSLFTKMSPMLADGFAPPDVVASVIAMLASDDGRFVTGTALRIDGGAHA